MNDEYVLGTNNTEIERLGLQHRVWRRFVLDAWERAGLNEGMTAADLGAGPGHAAIDLARIVGALGRVDAYEVSERFCAAMHRLGAENLVPIRADLASAKLPRETYDFVWCRWLLPFVGRSDHVVAQAAAALRPGGTAVFHEYLDYSSWHLLPPVPEVERFVALVMQSWREAGGDPDVGQHLPAMLHGEGLEIVETRPLNWIATPRDYSWRWPEAFVLSNTARLSEIGMIDAKEAEAIRAAWSAAARRGEVRMSTPMVIEVIARRPG